MRWGKINGTNRDRTDKFSGCNLFLLLLFFLFYFILFFEQGMFIKSTLDSIFKVGFSIDLDCLYGSREEGVQFSRVLLKPILCCFIDMHIYFKRISGS